MVRDAVPGTGSYFRSRGFKVLVAVLAIIIVLWAAIEIAAPLVADAIAKREIQKRYPSATDVSVSIRAFPALKLAFKKYDSLKVQVGNVTLQGVTFDKIVLKSNSWPNGTFVATLGQGEIVKFFSLKNSYIENPQLSIQQNNILVSGMVNVGPFRVNVTSGGALEAVNGKTVYFRPATLDALGVKAPEAAVALVRQVMDQNPVFVVRQDLPYVITGIAAEQGKLVISGSVNLEQALNIHL